MNETYESDFEYMPCIQMTIGHFLHRSLTAFQPGLEGVNSSI